MTEEVDSKASSAALQDLQLFRDGGLIGPCGQWQWTSGKLLRDSTVPWNLQCTPYDEQHFVQHKVSRNDLGLVFCCFAM